jgi:hypothetical protein
MEGNSEDEKWRSEKKKSVAFHLKEGDALY